METAASLVPTVVLSRGGGGWDTGPAALGTDALADLLVHGIAA